MNLLQKLYKIENGICKLNKELREMRTTMSFTKEYKSRVGLNKRIKSKQKALNKCYYETARIDKLNLENKTY